MAQLSVILSNERGRETAEERRIIRLYADGSFYRAYEWSAWLCCLFMRAFKVTKRHIQSVDADMTYIGFPQTSWEKFRIEGSTVEKSGEKDIVMQLPESLFNEEQINNMPAEYEAWKTSIPLVEPKEKDKTPPSLAQHPVSLTGIMRKVLEWQVEQHSPIESMLFLADVKKQLAELL